MFYGTRDLDRHILQVWDDTAGFDVNSLKRYIQAAAGELGVSQTWLQQLRDGMVAHYNDRQGRMLPENVLVEEMVPLLYDDVQKQVPERLTMGLGSSVGGAATQEALQDRAQSSNPTSGNLQSAKLISARNPVSRLQPQQSFRPSGLVGARGANNLLVPPRLSSATGAQVTHSAHAVVSASPHPPSATQHPPPTQTTTSNTIIDLTASDDEGVPGDEEVPDDEDTNTRPALSPADFTAPPTTAPEIIDITDDTPPRRKRGRFGIEARYWRNGPGNNLQASRGGRD